MSCKKINNNSELDLGRYKHYLDSFIPYTQKVLGYNKPFVLNLQSDQENSKKALGRTAFYDPNTDEVTIYVDGRHIKDIMRSIAHELVHHTQNCRGEFEGGCAADDGYAQTDSHLRGMEREAYETGNMLFRDWEDGYKRVYGENIMKTKIKVLREEIKKENLDESLAADIYKYTKQFGKGTVKFLRKYAPGNFGRLMTLLPGAGAVRQLTKAINNVTVRYAEKGMSQEVIEELITGALRTAATFPTFGTDPAAFFFDEFEKKADGWLEKNTSKGGSGIKSTLDPNCKNIVKKEFGLTDNDWSDMTKAQKLQACDKATNSPFKRAKSGAGRKGKASCKKVLRRGCKGPNVEALQKKLKKLGYTIDVDGAYGPGTAKVVKKFQEKANLKVDGMAGPNTNKAIDLALKGPLPAPEKSTNKGIVYTGEQVGKIVKNNLKKIKADMFVDEPSRFDAMYSRILKAIQGELAGKDSKLRVNGKMSIVKISNRVKEMVNLLDSLNESTVNEVLAESKKKVLGKRFDDLVKAIKEGK